MRPELITPISVPPQGTAQQARAVAVASACRGPLSYSRGDRDVVWASERHRDTERERDRERQRDSETLLARDRRSHSRAGFRLSVAAQNVESACAPPHQGVQQPHLEYCHLRRHGLGERRDRRAQARGRHRFY